MYYSKTLDRKKYFKDYISGDFTKIVDEVSKYAINLNIFLNSLKNKFYMLEAFWKKSVSSMKCRKKFFFGSNEIALPFLN